MEPKQSCTLGTYYLNILKSLVINYSSLISHRSFIIKKYQHIWSGYNFYTFKVYSQNSKYEFDSRFLSLCVFFFQVKGSLYEHSLKAFSSFCLKENEWASQVVLAVENPPVSSGDVRDVGWISGSGRSLDQEMATCSSILAWKIPWTEEPGRLQSMGSQRVGHD